VTAAVLAAAVLAAGGGTAAAADDPRLRSVDPAELTYTYGVGSFRPEYVPPAPGSYALPVIDTVTDHPVLDADGRRTTLFALTRGRLAVVAFVYTTCVEATGCPFSLAVLHRLDRAIASDPALTRRVALVTVSFDPERDTPARMAVMRVFHQPRTDWHFVTTRDDTELGPLLDDFDQPVAKLRFDDGTWTGLFRHVLKVFLLDRKGRVRNVYSVGLLDPTLVLNDLRTLLLEPTPGR
jgi:cytochrome oxidase Cu insertion factor (SCO1/SenC/PrrC family)